MLIERAEMKIRAGLEAEFAAVLRDRARPLLEGVPGVGSVRFGQGVENPATFLLLVEWATIADHEAFKQTPRFAELIGLLTPFSLGGAMEHFELE